MKHIYLDIDGVINAMSNKPPIQNTGWTGEWRKETIAQFEILWATELVEAINSLAARDDVQIKWLTTWQDEAPYTFSPRSGINGMDWPFFETDEDGLRDMIDWWKLDAIRKDIDKTKPEKVVWLDDDIRFDGNTRNWVAENTDLVLAISPNSYHGLSRKHIEQITAFLDEE